VAAQPDFDAEWFDALTAESVVRICDEEKTKTLETRKFKFSCGCSLEKILPTLSAWKDNADELFGNDESLSIQCPRCGRRFHLTREDLV
jgi:molecular chaperone Hsp33